MSDEKHPFDVAAEKLRALADSPTAGQEASVDYWELKFATDETVGDYPQAIVSLEDAESHWSETDGLGSDGFPAVPTSLPDLTLQPSAHWTDVLSSSLWNEGYLLNDHAFATFQQCDLGAHREYAALVRDTHGTDREFTYLFCNNAIDPSSIDFSQSEFYIADILGIPKSPIEVGSIDDYVELQAKASAGDLEGVEEFSSLDYRKLCFRQGHNPSVDLFTLNQFGVRVYISHRFRNTILDSGISGVEIRPNKRLFASEK